MWIIIRHEDQVVGRVLTNRRLTLGEALELVGIDVDEMDGGDPKWDYEAFELEPLSDQEYAERYGE